jgi:hypothetical protein
MKSFLQILQESEYTLDSLNNNDQDELYEEFRDAYTKATGGAWDKDTFLNRARGWTFYGNPPGTPHAGGIAVRKQSKNRFKLNASVGSPRGVLEGAKELLEKEPHGRIWGAMTPEIIDMVLKIGKRYGGDNSFVQLPGELLKAIGPLMGGRADFDDSGSLNYRLSDGSIVKKGVVASKEMLRWFLNPAVHQYWEENNHFKIPQKVIDSIQELIDTGEMSKKGIKDLKSGTGNIKRQVALNTIKSKLFKEWGEKTFDNILYEAEPYTFLKILYESTLREEFSRDDGYFYHTTPSPDMAQAIVAKNVNFMENTGIAYGAGVYSFVKNPEEGDRSYGPNTIKIYANIKNYFILEDDVFGGTSNFNSMLKDLRKEKEPASNDYFIWWQLKKYNIDLGKREDEFWSGRQADRAHIIDDCTNKQHRPCDGIIYFGGRSDGDVGVLWNTDKLVPIEWKDAEGNIHKKGEIFYNKSNRNPATYTDYMKWKKKVGKENAKLYAGKEYQGFYPSKNHIIGEMKRGSDLGDIGEMDPELQLEAIKIDPLKIKYIKNPSDEIKNAALVKDGESIQFIENPTIDDIFKSILQPNDAFQYVYKKFNELKASEDPRYVNIVEKQAVKNHGKNIQYLENPSPELRKIALYQYPFAIQYLENPTEEEISYAVKEMSEEIERQGSLIRIVPEKFQTEEMQLEAINQDIRNIEFIPNPTENAMKAMSKYFEKNGRSWGSIYIFPEKLQLYLVKEDPFWVCRMKHPTERVQFNAVKDTRFRDHLQFINDDVFNRDIKLLINGRIDADTYEEFRGKRKF